MIISGADEKNYEPRSMLSANLRQATPMLVRTSTLVSVSYELSTPPLTLSPGAYKVCNHTEACPYPVLPLLY